MLQRNAVTLFPPSLANTRQHRRGRSVGARLCVAVRGCMGMLVSGCVVMGRYSLGLWRWVWGRGRRDKRGEATKSVCLVVAVMMLVVMVVMVVVLCVFFFFSYFLHVRGHRLNAAKYF
ncbi:hypothetical protein E2C01_085701 [Portunus trituberculatus]|uniref:Uncharacterized protein n=1 Tax=Portunus trituberculatus TaxID=210409 RepID=A0A5B7JEC9_PORTR|nr:hypothetical protein [Portunus trituberculatus]